MLTRKAVILAKKETTYGVDPTPAAADDAILCSVPEITPKAEKQLRDYVRESLSPLGGTIGFKGFDITFKTELKGSGTAGTAPELGPLFQACGMDETVDAGVSVTYAPVSSAFPSVTIYFYRDGLLHKMLGCRGSWSLDLGVGRFGVITWNFSGTYATPTDTTLVSGTYNATAPPVFLDAGLTLGSYSPIFTQLSLAMNNTIAQRRDANEADGLQGYEITGRSPSGSIDPEAVLIATKDFWSLWEDGTKEALSGVAGSTAGNICTISVPKAQYDSLAYADRDGIATYNLPFTCCLDSGDDEISLAFT